MTPSMTKDDGARVMCPTCLHEFGWNTDQTLYTRSPSGQYVPIEQEAGESDADLRDRKLGAWKRCPHSERAGPDPHFLPARYGAYGPPLIIAFVGGRGAGKSHLLAAMINEIDLGGLYALGASAEPLDPDQHDDYLAQYVTPLFASGRAIDPTQTNIDEATRFLDGFVLSYGSTTQTVVFFDISGEVLGRRRVEGNRFMLAVDAMIVVADWDRERPGSDPHQDAAVTWAIRRLQNQETERRENHEPERPVPVAIVINKCDEVRFEDPVLRWLRRPPLSAFRTVRMPDRPLLWQESRDAYAFLFQRGMHAWLRPYAAFRQATLHFVSATGTQGVPGTDEFGTEFVDFSRGVRPKRVLDPLVSILAMSGMFGPAARRIGIWPSPPEPDGAAGDGAS